MTMQNMIFLIIISILAITVAVIIILEYLRRVPAREVDSRKITLENRIDIVELFAALEFILKTEFELYENFLLNNTDKDLTTLSNSEFTNIYQDLSKRCLKACSAQFWELVEIYMTRESVQTYITQRVYGYLAEKIQASS